MYKIFNLSKFLERRRKLRKKSTPQEFKLWGYLKNKNLGIKFTRQHGIGPYIADFYCKEKNLVIELDGHSHKLEKEYDKERDAYFGSVGIKVLRFWNGKIDTDISKVLEQIRTEAGICAPAKGSSPSEA